MRICFLFNHDQPHQIAHSLSVALALAAMDSGAKIIVATPNMLLAKEVLRLCGDAIPPGISFIQLGLRTLERALARIGKRFGLTIIPVIQTQAEARIDFRNVADHALVKRIFVVREA